MGATRNTGYLENLIQYDASDNVAIATSVNPSYKVTLGGSMLGTSATFSGAVQISNTLTFPLSNGITFQNASGNSNVSVYNSGASGASIFYVTGAATFSSSVTATTANGNSLILRSGASNQYTILSLGRTSTDLALASASSSNQFFTGSVAGDAWFGSTNGTIGLGNDTTGTANLVIKGGNVGIGTTSPSQGRLVVSGAVTNSIMNVAASINGGNNALNIGDDGTNAAIGVGNSGTDIVFMRRVTGVYSEAMRITSGGEVLVGGTSNAAGGVIQALGSSGTIISVRTTTAGNTAPGIRFYHDGNDEFVIRGGSDLRFFSSGVNERMRITSGGAILVNTSSVGGKLYVYNPATDFQTNTIKGHDANGSTTTDGIIVAVAERNTTNNTFYALGYYNNGAGAWRFRVADSGNVTNTNNSYGALSDIKLKENIVDASPKLNDLLKVTVKNFNYIGSEEKQLGVIAQDLEKIFPSMIEVHVDRDADGNDLGTTTKSVKYSVFVPMLIKAIQEQQAQIEELKSKLS